MSKQRGSARPTRGAAASSPITGLLPFATTTCEESAPTLRASMCSAAASPAKTCRTLGKALASRVSAAVCGSSSHESFANYDRASSSWRTSQRSLLADWTPFSGAFPKQGMMRSGSTFELPTLVLRTDESDSSSSRGTWPTARVSSANGASAAEVAAGNPRRRLEAEVARWPTPAARDWKDNGDFTATAEGAAHGKLAHAAMGELSPSWVEMLMGFPDGWTSPPTSGPSAPTKRSPKANRLASRKAPR